MVKKMCLETVFKEVPHLGECFIYIDGSNIAYSRHNKLKKPRLSDILLVFDYLIKTLEIKKENIRCICDPSLKYYIDKPIEYNVLIEERIIIEAPKVADEFILSFALKHEFCFIVSNDRFRQYINQLPSKQWLEERRISFLLIDNQVCLSPNINYEKDFCLSRMQESSELTTLDILNRINKTEGKLELY
ncbi:MAG TPA: hypothetical protein ENI29_05720 [bacterium]|nr:hypothetical protein [bacterium]